MSKDRPSVLDDLWDKRTAFFTFVFVIAASLIVSYLYIQTDFWVIIGGLTVIAATIFLFSSPRALILTVFVAKPLIDMLWFASVSAGGASLNAQSLLSVVILASSLFYLAVNRVALPRRLLVPMLIVFLEQSMGRVVDAWDSFRDRVHDPHYLRLSPAVRRSYSRAAASSTTNDAQLVLCRHGVRALHCPSPTAGSALLSRIRSRGRSTQGYWLLLPPLGRGSVHCHLDTASAGDAG